MNDTRIPQLTPALSVSLGPERSKLRGEIVEMTVNFSAGRQRTAIKRLTPFAKDILSQYYNKNLTQSKCQLRQQWRLSLPRRC